MSHVGTMFSFGFVVVARVTSGFVVVVVGLLVPAESRFSNLVPGQQPFLEVSQLISVVAAVLAGASVAVVETGQLLPVASRFLMLVPGQHP